MFEDIIEFIRKLYNNPNDFIPLHEPKFMGNEKKYVVDAIDSTFVSSVGAYVDKFEEMMQDFTGAKYAIATVNGTSALHTALLVAGVKQGDEVITQPLTFVATVNAITYTGAKPVFVDVDRRSMGLSSEKLRLFLEHNTKIGEDGFCYNIKSGNKISACIPMHTFGFPSQIVDIVQICNNYNIPVVEDAAESLGSLFENRHTGTFGLLGTFSFNGNKTITSGGGGAIVTNDELLAREAKHLTTTGKIPSRWEYKHNVVAYNYRMPNLNAALACAQLEKIDDFVNSKRDLANCYKEFFDQRGTTFVSESTGSYANYWLNTILMFDKQERDDFLDFSNNNGVMTRPSWQLMNELTMYQNCQTADLSNASWLTDRIVNIPSSVRMP